MSNNSECNKGFFFRLCVYFVISVYEAIGEVTGKENKSLV